METKNSNTADRELLITRTLNAPLELVWEVWTDANHIANWWGPEGFTNTIHQMDLRDGGKWTLTMHGPDGQNYENESVFREIVPFKKIVYEHISYPSFVTTVEFEAKGAQTDIRWYMLFESAELFVQVVKTFKADEGLKQNLIKLNAYLEKHLGEKQN